MKGTILDFLQIAAKDPELAKGLAELAERFDFEFTEEELDDEDLGKVAGGTIGQVAVFVPRPTPNTSATLGTPSPSGSTGVTRSVGDEPGTSSGTVSRSKPPSS